MSDESRERVSEPVEPRVTLTTIMIMAGGTGGHIFPALAVAEYLRAQGWNVVWLGSRAGMEARLVAPRGYTMAWIRFSGVRGKGLAARSRLLPLELLVAFWQSARAIFAHRPDVVLGMGGYVSFPGGMMASLLNRPLVVHEQNSIAGPRQPRARASSPTACSPAFPDAFGARHRGHLDRQPGARGHRRARRRPRSATPGAPGGLQLLVLGGSQGAQVLNTVVPEALALLPAPARPAVTHQAGAAHLDAVARALPSARRRGGSGRVHRRHGAALRGGRSRSSAAPAHPRSPSSPRRASPRCWCRSRTRWTITRRATRAFSPSAAPRC